VEVDLIQKEVGMHDNKDNYHCFKITVLTATLILAGCAGVNKEQDISVNWRSKSAADLPNSSDYYAAGKHYFSLGRYGLALEQFEEELKKNERSIRALNGVAACYDKMGRYHVAMRYYDMALRIDPDSSLTLNNLGYSLTLQGRSNRAKKILSMAQAKSPDNEYVKANKESLAVQITQGISQRVLEPPASSEGAMINATADGIKQVASVNVPKTIKAAQNEQAKNKTKFKTNSMQMEITKNRAFTVNQKIEESTPSLSSTSKVIAGISEDGVKIEHVVHATSVVEEEQIREQSNAQKNSASIVQQENSRTVNLLTSGHMLRELEEAQHVEILKPSYISRLEEEPSHLKKMTRTAVAVAQPPNSGKVVQLSEPSSPEKNHTQTDYLYGPTRAGSSLWKIANELNADKKMGINQIMYALVASNPEAFVSGDIHRLKIGYMLWVPRNAEIVAMNMPKQSMPIDKNLSAFSLEVSNGNGRKGMAKMVSVYLREQGAKIAKISNAASFAVEDSTIYYAPG